jgi:hypothetical protein
MNTVRSVHRSPIHGFSKESTSSITLLTGLGVEGDAHCGSLVKHRSRVAVNPNQPNLRQVHLMMGETLDRLLSAFRSENPDGETIRRAGIMAIVINGGSIRVGDEIHIKTPDGKSEPLRPV